MAWEIAHLLLGHTRLGQLTVIIDIDANVLFLVR